MGVKGLWQLLLPTGRRISVETLSGKRLAIDASIWLTQFLKANRDPETGAVRANAHLIGFLRRICKLLYHGIKPVFVFDGATPEIKLREIRARKERRDRLNFFKSEDDNEGVKRLARRILVARLKKQKELEKSRHQALGVEIEAGSKSGIDNNSSDGTETEGAFASGFRIYSPIKGGENGEETTTEKQGKEEISDSEEVTIIDEVKRDVFISDKEDYLQTLTYEEQQMNNDWDDALLAAGSVSGESVASTDDSDNESTLDLHKLTSLPAKSRVDVIEKARRNQRLQSRKEFMSVAADPHSYSQCQLKNFLKSANLNKQVHKLGEMDAICSRDGLEGERIASDSTRRFIFTKDKTKSDSITRQVSEKHSTASPPSEHGLNLALKSKDHTLHEVDGEVDMEGGFFSVGGGFIGDGNASHYDNQMTPNPLDQSYDNQGGFIANDDEEVLKKCHDTRDEIEVSSTGSFSDVNVPSYCLQSTKQSYDDQGGFIANDDDEVVLNKSHDTRDKIEVSSTDSFTDVNVPTYCLQSAKPLVDKTQRHEHRAFNIDTSNHIPNSVPKPANKESPIMIADSAMSINQYIDGQHKNEDNCYQSISPCKHSDKRETFERGALNDELDMVLKVSNTESFVLTADSAKSYNPCINGQHKGEGTSNVLISRHKYSTCQDNNEESRPSALQGKDEEEEEGDEDDDDDVDWEDGEDTSKDITFDDFGSCHDVMEDTRDFNKSHTIHDSYGTPTISKKRVRSCDYNDMEHDQFQTLNTEVGHHDNESTILERKDNNNANAAALLSAHATASQLTDWAGRVVRKAIQMHLGEQVDEKNQVRPESTESDSCSSSEDEAIHNNQSVENPSGDISANSQAYDLREFVDTSLEALQRQDDILRDEDNRRERDMDTVTEEMIEDVILLLTLFGVPYLRAPAEAEAQAVELEKLGLVDGVVTEDSDAIVFGSRSVYRNIFDDKKYVELYLSSDSEAIGVGYNEKIALAMLLGGDYTQGVKGVGIVNGMEILKTFPVTESVLGGLNAFRNWLDGFELDDKTNSDNPNLAEFTKKHKSARSRWLLPSNFPSTIVWQAYTRPVVDSSQTNFSWGVPDVDAIRTFLSKKVGWEVAEINRIILPVTKAMAEAKTQKRIDGYFMRSEDNIKFADVRSKRLRRVWELDKRYNSETEGD